MMRQAITVFLALTLPLLATAQEGAAFGRQDQPFGTVVTPAALPAGASAVHGYVGVPEMGAGYRLGFEALELEGRLRLDYFRVSATFEVVGRRQVLERGPVALAPTLGLGLVLNSGAAYLDEDNFGGVLLRVEPGLVASWSVAETVALVGLVDVPVDLGLDPSGARRIQALAGGGTELYLGEGMTLLIAGQLGVENFKEPRKPAETRLGYLVKLGIGTRLF